MKCTPIAKDNPAGLDKLILALAKGSHDFVQRKAANYGVRLDWWRAGDRDGLEAVIKDVLADQRIPNKTAPELVTPRAILRAVGVISRRRRRRDAA